MSNTLEKSNQERGHVHFTGCCQKFQGWNGSNFFRLHRLRLLGIDTHILELMYVGDWSWER